MYRTQCVTDPLGLGLGLLNLGEPGDVCFLGGTNRLADEALNCGDGGSGFRA